MVTSWSETQMNDGLLFWFSGFWSLDSTFDLSKAVQTRCPTAWRLGIMFLVHQRPLWHFAITTLYMTAPSLKWWYKWTDWKGNIIGSANEVSFSTKFKQRQMSWPRALLTPTAKPPQLTPATAAFLPIDLFHVIGSSRRGEMTSR